MSVIVRMYLDGVEEAFVKSRDTLSNDAMFYLSVGTFLPSIIQLVLTSLAKKEYHDGERYIYILFALCAVVLNITAMFEWLAASQVLVGARFAFGTSSDLIFPASVWKRCKPYANQARCHVLVDQLSFDQWYENSNVLIQVLSNMQPNIQAMFIIYIISVTLCIGCPMTLLVWKRRNAELFHIQRTNYHERQSLMSMTSTRSDDPDFGVTHEMNGRRNPESKRP